MSTEKRYIQVPLQKLKRSNICAKRNAKMFVLIILTIVAYIFNLVGKISHLAGQEVYISQPTSQRTSQPTPQPTQSFNQLSLWKQTRSKLKYNPSSCKKLFRKYKFKKKNNSYQLSTANQIKIYNVFPYDGEKELLLTRLHELSDIVDYFIIVESQRSYNPTTIIYKPIKFHKTDTAFQQFSSQILHVIISDQWYNEMAFNTTGLFFREWFRLQVISEFLFQHPQHYPQPNDLFLGTDLDELTKYEVISPFKQCNLNGYKIPWPMTFELTWYLYDFGCEVKNDYSRGHKPLLVPFHRLFGNPQCTEHCFMYRRFNALKKLRGFNNVSISHVRERMIRSAGWHLSYFMPLEMMHDKLDHAGDKGKDKKKNHDALDCYVSTCHHIRNVYKTLPRSKIIHKVLNRSCNEYISKYPIYMLYKSCQNNSYFNFFPSYNSFSKCNYTQSRSIVERNGLWKSHWHSNWKLNISSKFKPSLPGMGVFKGKSIKTGLSSWKKSFSFSQFNKNKTKNSKFKTKNPFGDKKKKITDVHNSYNANKENVKNVKNRITKNMNKVRGKQMKNKERIHNSLGSMKTKTALN